jgi:hypothetical protein
VTVVVATMYPRAEFQSDPRIILVLEVHDGPSTDEDRDLADEDDWVDRRMCQRAGVEMAWM